MLPPVDKARWPALSPLLDELLDLDADRRAARLAALRSGDAALADELTQLLDHMAAMDDDAFMEAPALPPPRGLLDGPGGAGGVGGVGDEDLAGRRVGSYTLERELGRGGMGSVWLARRTDGRYEGQVAIKFLRAGLFGHGDGGRFAREGSILARLAHPHIARLLDAGQLQGSTPGSEQPYLVLEYVAGEPIDRYCSGRGLELEARLRLFLDVLSAVAHAHNRLILHRDLKPSNILVTAAGEVKLLDFGIAKLLDAADQPAGASELTRSAGYACTPQYAAPEQMQGGDVTTATDVYALGVLLYLLLGGRHPTAEPTEAPLKQMQALVELEPPRVSDVVQRTGGASAARRARALRGDLDTIVARALKKHPAERYANAADLADDLRRYLAHEPIAARPDGWRYRLAKFLRRHRLAVAAGTSTALALAGAAAVALHEARVAQQQQVQAEGLIEFMLGDLSGKLKPVGRLDALDAVGDRALAYYAAQDPGRLDAASLGRRARALHLAGEIAEQRGQLDEAARRFAQAAESTAELVARHPYAPEHVFNHSQSEYWVGFIARRRGLPAEAEAAFSRYLALAQRLTRLEPAKLDWRIERAYAGQNLGVLLLEAGRPAEAQKAFEQTRQAWQDVVAARPEMANELANTLGWIAKAREALHDYAAAIAAQEAKREVLARAPDAARNRDAQYLGANARYEIGRLQLALGQAEASEASARQALAQFQALVQAEAGNLDWLAQLGLARLSLAEAQLAQGTRQAAREQLEPLKAIATRLMAQPQRKVRWDVNLRGRLLALQAKLAAGASAGAFGAPAAAELAAYLDDIGRHEATGKPLDAEQARIVAAAGLALGDLLLRERRGSAAAAQWAAATRRLQPGAQRQELPAVALLGLLAWRQGAAQDARQWADKLEPSTYRHPDVIELRRLLAQPAPAAR